MALCLSNSAQEPFSLKYFEIDDKESGMAKTGTTGPLVITSVSSAILT
jgi:hypothetical protein